MLPFGRRPRDRGWRRPAGRRRCEHGNTAVSRMVLGNEPRALPRGDLGRGQAGAGPVFPPAGRAALTPSSRKTVRGGRSARPRRVTGPRDQLAGLTVSTSRRQTEAARRRMRRASASGGTLAGSGGVGGRTSPATMALRTIGQDVDARQYGCSAPAARLRRIS